MKTRTKLLLFLIATGVCFIFSLFLLIQVESYNLKQLKKQTQIEQETIIKNLIAIMAKTQQNFASDYSFWDDTADFIKTQDIAWADANIASGLKTFAGDFAWVYNPDFSQIYLTASNEDLKALVQNLFSKEDLKHIFSKGKKFPHFFIKAPAGIVEIHGAVIVYETDKERANSPEGYLLFGKLWNKAFLEQLSIVSDSKVSFLEQQTNQKLSETKITFVLDLQSWDSTIAAKVLVQREMVGVKAFAKITRDVLVFVALLWIILLSIILWFFRKWIIQPLEWISESLVAEDDRHIGKIENGRDEFGQIAKLIKKFIAQKKHLDHEIKERNKIAEQLQQEKGKAQNYLSVASVIIVALNPKGEVTLINQKGCEILGREASEIININWFDNFIAKEMRIEAKALFQQIIVGQHDLMPYFENVIVSNEGKERLIAWKNVYLRDSNNQIFEVLSSGEDISDRKEIEKSQRFAQLGQFVSRMAHEVNNPLMIISGRAQLSLMEQPENQEIKNNLETIMSECQRAKEIIMRLLKFSKPGKKETEPIEVNKIIEESILLIEHQFNINNIAIMRNYANDLPLIKINTKELQEVMMNLLINAEDAIAGQGSIAVKTYCQDKYVKIDIQDTGQGMTNEVLEKVFDPFFTTKATGTGLGLAVSYSIMKANKGDIILKSSIGQGTTVTLILPILSF